MKTIRKILQEAGCPPAQSVYEDAPILDYEMPVDHGWELKKVNLEQRSFIKVQRFLDAVYRGKHTPEYLDLKANIKSVPREDRTRKASLRKTKKAMKAEIRQGAFANAFPGANPQDDIYAVSYKSGVYAIDLAELLPPDDINRKAVRNSENAASDRYRDNTGKYESNPPPDENPCMKSSTAARPLPCEKPEDIPWFVSDAEWFAKTCEAIRTGSYRRGQKRVIAGICPASLQDSNVQASDKCMPDNAGICLASPKNPDVQVIDKYTPPEQIPGSSLGMEGGYCILGTDEMLFHIFLEDGAEHIFDFNTMQELTGAAPDIITSETDTALWNFMQANSSRVRSVAIECDKDRITVDEYTQLYYLFVMADFFGAKLVVTIPDMSYDKTFVQTFGGIPTELFEKLHAEFLAHLDRISDICIAWVEKFRKAYPDLEVEVLHRRNEDFLNIFYDKRKDYLDSYAKKHLTTIRDGRRDALMDYVCMPAAPFYKWGTRDVIEVNRLEEYPSIEKCRRMHRGAMHLHSMLFPQALSKNGATSGFYARRKYKEYVGM
ncbi:MAG: hypothetical protein Q4A32_10600 [Lachnospiraceae bacterium]|nr:hypothetical protein [Lachnospiraceae bacterium]